jgi:hypothetical protein
MAKPMTMAVRTSAWLDPFADDRRQPDVEPPHDEYEEVDGVADQRQAEHHRKGAPAQQQVHAAGDQNADRR